ncbi:SCO1664 family protein [Cellulomonas humilata]|uniref:Repeat protein (TIGR03843 family) n=1 Tax=Cellulomonas humilata TaxID=144055 RepID=A0ABU0EFA7_9CELL|nr:SCO1664 family protein [Cellulomonas humilata]MDQ0373951.1 putative repeat protein (TIGR03843 family) [Cellulomonas humilata]
MTPDLVGGELELVGRITVASNATFLATIGGTSVVYKPVAGERPLWDFPDETLANREAAAYLVSEAFGWDIVPETLLRDGPLGPGMVQLWQQPDAAQDPVDVVPAHAVPPDGWRSVFDGIDDRGQPLTLIHEDSPALRRMAVFDVVVNNADRKGGHVLPVADGHRYGVDHGVSFHVEHKLRTVLWGWRGEPLDAAEVAGVEQVRAGLDRELGQRLSSLLSTAEVEALAERCDRLLRTSTFPGPSGDMPAFPWPFF